MYINLCIVWWIKIMKYYNVWCIIRKYFTIIINNVKFHKTITCMVTMTNELSLLPTFKVNQILFDFELWLQWMYVVWWIPRKNTDEQNMFINHYWKKNIKLSFKLNTLKRVIFMLKPFGKIPN